MKRLAVLLLPLALTTACERAQTYPLAAADAAAASPRLTVVDSARAIEVELARFRESLAPRRVDRLATPARSRDELVRTFLRALEDSDTVTLQRLLLDPAEFAWLYYPYTVHTHPPYQQAPAVVWLLMTQNSRKGLSRLLQRYGGERLMVAGVTCGPTRPQDLNLLHEECGVRLEGDTASRALFGTIIERGGRFKFVSYANGL